MVAYGSPDQRLARGIAMFGTTMWGTIFGTDLSGGSAIEPFVATVAYESNGFTWFYGEEFWVGSISEVVLIDGAVSTSQRPSLERSQGAVYGIPVS